MKRIFTSVVVLLGTTIAYAQYEGRVGINTDTPTATIDIKSKTGTDATTKNLELQNANGTKLVTVLDNGNVGVGTQKPNAPLEVINKIAITGQTNITPVFELYNNSKLGSPDKAFAWRVYNMTGNETNQGYKNALSFWSYHHTSDTDFTSINQHRMSILDNGNVVIGGEVLARNPDQTAKLNVNGTILSTELKGTGDRAVFADENGVLKTGTMSIKATTTDATCTATNEGTMHYKLVDRNGKQVGLFGFCTRDANGEFLWAYQLGGNNLFSVPGNQAFGTGL